MLRVGDKVMQTINNYDKNVYNGDIGRVMAIDDVDANASPSASTAAPVVYDFLEMDELAHAFAVSVHKSAGQRVPLRRATGHHPALHDAAAQSASTPPLPAPRRLVILVGTRRAIRIAINNARVNERYTALDYRLRGGPAPLGATPGRGVGARCAGRLPGSLAQRGPDDPHQR